MFQKIPLQERPRERLLRCGSSALSVQELLCVLLGRGVKGTSIHALSCELLSHFGDLQRLAEATVEELCQIKGVGKAKALQLKAAFSLVCRLQQTVSETKKPLIHPEQVYQLVKESLAHQNREVFMVILQDVKCRFIAQEVVSIGTLSQALVHPREVFYIAIRHKASSLILAHNHPSGDPTPSPQDYALTEKLIEAGKLLGIPVRDHLIIGRESYVSLRQSNKLYFKN